MTRDELSAEIAYLDPDFNNWAWEMFRQAPQFWVPTFWPYGENNAD